MAIWADATFVWDPNHGGRSKDLVSDTESDVALDEGSEVTVDSRPGRAYSGAVGSRFGIVAAANPHTTGITLMYVARSVNGNCIFWTGDKDSGGKYILMSRSGDELHHDWRGSLWLNDEYHSTDLLGNTSELVCFILVFSADGTGAIREDLYVGDRLVAGTDAASIANLDIDRVTVGRTDDSTPGNATGGEIFAATTWDRALTPAEIRAVASDPYSYPNDPADPGGWVEGTAGTEWEGSVFYWQANHDGTSGKNLLSGGGQANELLVEGTEVTQDTREGRLYDSTEGSRFAGTHVRDNPFDPFPRDFSIMAVMSRADVSSGGVGLLAHGGDTASWFHVSMADNGSNTDFKADLRHSNASDPGGNNWPIVTITDVEDTDIHVLVARGQISGGNITVELFVDTLANTASDTESWSGDPTTMFEKFTVGRLDDSTPSNSTGIRVFAAAGWDRVLTDDEVTAVLADPYGFPGTVPSVFFDLTDMPADFGNAESASIEVRAKTDGATAAIKLYVQLFQSDETTALSNEVEAVSLDTDAAFANFTATITGIDTVASKAVWDNARVRFRWSSV